MKRPDFECGQARAAPSHFPYKHGSLAEQDRKMLEAQARAQYARECAAIMRKVFG
jgi:hypothetical protein